ncbi:MAG TPA: sialidase family protein, partial [Tepidisphaeraceae bacterium]|nr:sialidase family protein [Tepidisphaeraceae bacterium]
MHYRRRSPAGSLAVAALAMGGSTALAAQPPQVLNPGTYANLVRFSDGSIKRVRASNGYLRSQTSLDHGLTWSSEVAEFPLAGSTNPVPVIDLSNQLHYVRLLVRDETNGGTRIPNVNYFLDIWHYTAHDGVNWTANMAQAAYTGSIMDAISLTRGSARGRLIVPYGDAFVGSSGGYGKNFTKVIYSDDAGRTWHASPSQLKSPVPAGWNGSPDGACEPSIAELGDGQLWMLMRTQASALYESRSDDAGVTWSEARPSLFYSSTGPPNFLRLDDGRLMLFWNNATMPPRYNGSIVYAGRDALHAAISEDDGKTWKGFREVYLDPYRNENPITGDSGTAYPFPAATADGRALVIAGQAQARAMLRINPDWLLETSRSSDFANGLADWSVFKPYGPVINVKRNRKVGPQLVFDPQENKQVMHLRRPDSDDPDGAAWNFPMAKKGQTQLRLKISAGFGGGVISLGDRFFEPTDAQGEANAIFQIPISAD